EDKKEVGKGRFPARGATVGEDFPRSLPRTHTGASTPCRLTPRQSWGPSRPPVSHLSRWPRTVSVDFSAEAARNARKTDPSWIWSPSESRTGLAPTRLPLTKVPFLLPRSAIVAVLAATVIRACRRETVPS